MYDDGIEGVEFPTPICPITEPHAKHRIPGTWRDECPGVAGDRMDPSAALASVRAAFERLDDLDPVAALSAAEDARTAFERLDGWLSRGGFLPVPWQATRGVRGADSAYVPTHCSVCGVLLGQPHRSHGTELP
jgi:hypothetical protein